MNSSASVAYLDIGTAVTSLTITHDDTSTCHQQRTPATVARSKRLLYRGEVCHPSRASSTGTREYGGLDEYSLVLDTYLRTLCESFLLSHAVDHMVLLVDPSDTREFLLYALHFLSAIVPSHVSVSSASCPVFVAAVAGVGRHAVVVDLGNSITRLVPILHCEEVKELWCGVVGVGIGARLRSANVSNDSAVSSTALRPFPTWPDTLQSLLDEYLLLRMEVELGEGEEGGGDNVPEGEGVAQSSQRIAARHKGDQLTYMERFTSSLEEAMEDLIRRVRTRGMGVVLSTWIIAGGGAHIPSVRNFVGYLLSLHVPEAIIVWT